MPPTSPVPEPQPAPAPLPLPQAQPQMQLPQAQPQMQQMNGAAFYPQQPHEINNAYKHLADMEREAQRKREAEHDLWDPLSDKLWERDTDWERESVVELRRIAYILDSILKVFTWLPAFFLLSSSFIIFIVICSVDFDACDGNDGSCDAA